MMLFVIIQCSATQMEAVAGKMQGGCYCYCCEHAGKQQMHKTKTKETAGTCFTIVSGCCRVTGVEAFTVLLSLQAHLGRPYNSSSSSNPRLPGLHPLGTAMAAKVHAKA